MSRIYNYRGTFSIGDLARAIDVESEFLSVQSALESLPAISPDGVGFSEPFRIAPATEAYHPITLAQLEVAQIAVVTDKAAAKLYAEQAEASAINAEAARDATSTASAEITALASGILDIKNLAEEQADRSQVGADLSRDWAQKPFGQTVDGPGTRSAQHYSIISSQYADEAEGFADTARSLTSGARKFMGYHDASGGTTPIAAPTSTDRGKYWIISVAGTLPTVGAVTVNQELSINALNAYEAAAVHDGFVRSVNGKTGNAVVVTLADIDAAARLHNHPEYLNKALNLADIPSKSEARTALGLGSAATKAVGVGPYEVVQRDANGNIPGSNQTSSATANRLTTPVSISLTGGVAGQVTTDLGGPVVMATTVNPDNHAHTKLSASTDIGFASGTLTQTKLVHARAGTGWPATGSVLNIPGGLNGQGAMQLYCQDGATPTLQYRLANNQTGTWGPLQTTLTQSLSDELYLAKSGTAARATRLAEARQVKITGDVTGSSNAFDGSQDASISVTLDAAKVLAKIVSVDGAGSGLDADKLDGIEAAGFAKIGSSKFGATPIWSGSATTAAIPMTDAGTLCNIRVLSPTLGLVQMLVLVGNTFPRYFAVPGAASTTLKIEQSVSSLIITAPSSHQLYYVEKVTLA